MGTIVLKVVAVCDMHGIWSPYKTCIMFSFGLSNTSLWRQFCEANFLKRNTNHFLNKRIRCVPLWINWISIYKIPFFLNDAIDFVAGLSASPTNEGFIPWLFQRRFWLNRILNKCDFYFIPRLPEFIFLWGIFPASEFLSTSEMVTSYSICYVYVWIVSSLDIHDALNSNCFISFIEDRIM